MSHFTVLVIGPDPEKQLAPYHEFECTGEDNEYIQDIDITAKVRSEFANDKVRRYKDPNGKLHDPYQDKFYRDPTEKEVKEIGPISGTGGNGKGLSWTSKDWGDGRGYRAKIHSLPKGWKEVKAKRSAVEEFRDYVEDYNGKKVIPFGSKPDLNKDHKYGYALEDKAGKIVKIIRRTNPNAKWDWYQLGGRWRGFFKLKRRRLQEVLGRPGVPEKVDGERDLPDNVADQSLKGDIDFNAMRDADADEAGKRYDQLAALFGGEIPKLTMSWEEVQKGKKADFIKKRDRYLTQPALKKLEAIRKRKDISDEDRSLALWADLSNYQGGREAYVGRAIRDAIVTFAVVKDGKWYERGEMGWWASVSNEKDRGEWATELRKLLDSVPDDTLMTVVDCHI